MTRGQNNEAHHGFVGIISVGVVVVSENGNSGCFRLRAPVPGYQMDGDIRASGLVSLRVCSEPQHTRLFVSEFTTSRKF